MSNTMATSRTRKTTKADENSLYLYLRDINRVPLLSREEEERLAGEAARGVPAAKEKLIRANLRFVVNIARKYQHRGLPLEDLVSEGNIGLMHAIERFDVTKGYHFISYAVWWIRQSILKALSEKSRMIRLPMNRAIELAQIERGDEARSATGNAARLLNISREPISLDAPVGLSEDSSLLGETVEDRRYRLQEQLAVDSFLREDLKAALGTLARKEAEIITARFGLNGGKPLSLSELGARYRLTKERIRQIERRAIRRLQRPEGSRLLLPYVQVPIDRCPAGAGSTVPA